MAHMVHRQRMCSSVVYLKTTERMKTVSLLSRFSFTSQREKEIVSPSISFLLFAKYRKSVICAAVTQFRSNYFFFATIRLQFIIFSLAYLLSPHRFSTNLNPLRLCFQANSIFNSYLPLDNPVKTLGVIMNLIKY